MLPHFKNASGESSGGSLGVPFVEVDDLSPVHIPECIYKITRISSGKECDKDALWYV